MEWDAQELPLAALEARIARLRAEMKRAGLDAFIIYTNLVRPSAVAHLTAFTPYWSEGLLLVPAEGRLTFATALSNRVADWIRSTNPVSDVISTPRPGALLGERIAMDAPVKRAGILEIDTMPAELADHLAVAAPAVQWVDGSAAFAAARRPIDAAEQRILAHCDAIAVAALDQAGAASIVEAGILAGLVEKQARLAGAEEAYIAIAPDLNADRRFNRVSKPTPLADRFAVRASVAYKGSWVRRTRTFAKSDAVTLADAWFKDTVEAIEAGKPLAVQLETCVATLPGATLKDWTAESCVGSYPLEVVASSPQRGSDVLTTGTFLVLTVELTLDGSTWVGSAPAYAGKAAL